MANQKMSLEEATSARLPFDVAEHIDIVYTAMYR